MGTVETLALAMGTAWTSGINLYATVAVLGLAHHAGMIDLPSELQETVANPFVIGVASVMYLVEFFADKIPYVDNAWDSIHTFIRVPAGALLAAGAVGDTAPALELAAMLGGGTVALVSHGTKATARLAVNTSPEPFSNWIVSIGEDLAVIGGLWLSFQHPWVMLTFLILFLLFAVWLIPKLFRLAKRGFQALRSWLRGERQRNAPLEAPSTPPT